MGTSLLQGSPYTEAVLRPSSGMSCLGCVQGRASPTWGAWSGPHISAEHVAITPYLQAATRVEGSSGTRAVTSLLHSSISEVSHFLFSQLYAGSASHRHWFQSDTVELSLHPLCLAESTQCHDACAYLFLRAGSPSLFQQRASVFSGLQPCFPLRSSELGRVSVQAPLHVPGLCRDVALGCGSR